MTAAGRCPGWCWLFPVKWVVPAVPGFGTAGTRAAALGWHGEGRPSFGVRARSAPFCFLRLGLSNGAKRPLGGKGVRGKWSWGFPRCRAVCARQRMSAKRLFLSCSTASLAASPRKDNGAWGVKHESVRNIGSCYSALAGEAAGEPAWACAEEPPESAVQVRLVAEADGRRCGAWRHAVEQEPAG